MRACSFAIALATCALSVGAPTVLTAQTTPQTAEISAEQRTALLKTVDEFETAMRKENYEQVIFISIPPKFIQGLAKENGITGASLDQLRAAPLGQMRDMMKTVTLVRFKMDPAAARFFHHADGSPYAYIPTESVFAVPGAGQVRTQSQTVAFQEDGKWYLMRVSDQQVPLIKRIYPQFANVTFEPPVITRVGQ